MARLLSACSSALLLLCLCVAAPLFASLVSGEELVHIALERSVNADKRAAALMSLKLRQVRMIDGTATSLLETKSREIPLEEEILSEKHLATYFGHIAISGNDFKVLFDTGSCEFWVPSSLCTTARCMRHNRFPQDRSREKVASATGMNIQVRLADAYSHM